MKLLLGVLCLVACAYCDDNFTAVFRPDASFCICATKVDISLAEKWYNQRICSLDACFKCFFKCLLMQMGIFDYNGNIQKPVVMKKLSVAEALVDSCISLVANEKDLCEKAYKFIKCLETTGTPGEICDF